MKSIKKIFSLCLAVVMVLTCIPTAFAAEVADATIDMDAKGSVTLYKYDLTNSEKDGVWDSSYVSTGVYDQAVNDTLGGAIREGDTDNTSDLGNGQQSFGYAIRGVEFSYLRIADIVQFSESTADGATSNHVEVLYAIDKVTGADFLRALGLENGAQRYTNADQLNTRKYHYQSDVLIDALAAALESNATTVKNALESYITANGGTAMPLTDAYGKTSATDLDLGLYLFVETAVPEMVVTTTNPFLVSVPMTSIDGTNATDGGTRWLYDITLYPKNLTGIPSLEKTMREAKADTGKNNGSKTDITDGYAHTGTASAGDVIDFQIISTLPAITSKASYLTTYTFIDTSSNGLKYCKNDIILEFFTDAACTDLITTWRESDGKFKVTYNEGLYQDNTMTIEMTTQGLAEINTAKTVYTGANMVNSGYSDCTLRITYAATMDTDDSLTAGDQANPNTVVLTWQRSSQDYYDTLVDDCHSYTFGVELTKLFSDGQGDFSNVEFIIHNDTDNYYVTADLEESLGVYHVTGHVAEEKDATHFIPVTLPMAVRSAASGEYKVIVHGLEDDTYTITEVRTDDGYTLLKESITVVISCKETTELCGIYERDVLGLIQNDPRYAEIINGANLQNMPQKHLEHKLLTASATVDSNDVNMLADGNSVNAYAPLTVVNTRGFDLPATGDHGVWMYGVVGIGLMSAAMFLLLFACRKKEDEAPLQQ